MVASERAGGEVGEAISVQLVPSTRRWNVRGMLFSPTHSVEGPGVVEHVAAGVHSSEENELSGGLVEGHHVRLSATLERGFVPHAGGERGPDRLGNALRRLGRRFCSA